MKRVRKREDKAQTSRRGREIINTRAEINETIIIHRINELFFEEINNTEKLLAKPPQRKRGAY